MRISDWSSDVCSSDLVAADAQRLQGDAERDRARELQLDRRLAPGHRSEERAQGDERLAVEARVGERRSRIDGLLVGLQVPGGTDLDARYAPSRPQVGRATVCNPILNCHSACRFFSEKKHKA